ncbi:glycosyltransferase family 2 protein [Oleidesulfovibrio sp.]|uniref:glycosyltransferase family 2 protein n=1 Tax=Oleidesulfovibrio sp. TaxID=2909707 RepID=UPI003A8B2C20
MLSVFFSLILLFSSLALAWLFLLCVTGWRRFVRRPVAGLDAAGEMHQAEKTGKSEQPVRFAVVIPAHNEEADIVATVKGVLALDYPAEDFCVVVVADNCTDNTAKVAYEAGASVLVRNNDVLKGKGYALRYAFDALLGSRKHDVSSSHDLSACVALSGLDAVVVLDADTLPCADMLHIFAAGLHQGKQVQQAEYGILNPDAAALTWLLHVGNVMENILFHEGRMRLGLPTVLRGNGMCFAAEVLCNHPWQAFSITEDTEYTLELLRNGIRTEYVPQAQVLAESPVTVEQLRMQRLRWASGNAGLSRREAFVLMRNGMKQRNVALFDAGWSMIVGSRPLLLLSALIPFAGGVLTGSAFIAWWGFFLLAGQGVLLAAGMVSAGLNSRRMRWSLFLPVVVFELVSATLKGMLGVKRTVWQRTKRI